MTQNKKHNCTKHPAVIRKTISAVGDAKTIRKWSLLPFSHLQVLPSFL
jgi:hypothetical protein